MECYTTETSFRFFITCIRPHIRKARKMLHDHYSDVPMVFRSSTHWNAGMQISCQSGTKPIKFHIIQICRTLLLFFTKANFNDCFQAFNTIFRNNIEKERNFNWQKKSPMARNPFVVRVEIRTMIMMVGSSVFHLLWHLRHYQWRISVLPLDALKTKSIIIMLPLPFKKQPSNFNRNKIFKMHKHNRALPLSYSAKWIDFLLEPSRH